MFQGHYARNPAPECRDYPILVPTLLVFIVFSAGHCRAPSGIGQGMRMERSVRTSRVRRRSSCLAGRGSETTAVILSCSMGLLAICAISHGQERRLDVGEPIAASRTAVASNGNSAVARMTSGPRRLAAGSRTDDTDRRPRPQLLTYPDSLGGDLRSLGDLLEGPLAGVFQGVHVLPPFPHRRRGARRRPTIQRFGTWDDIRRIASGHDVLLDLMINHISRQSQEFQDFQRHGRKSEFADLFITIDKIWPDGVPAAADVARSSCASRTLPSRT